MNYKPLIFLGIPLVMYLGQSVFVYAKEGRWGMALCMAAYSLANVGLVLDAYGY